MQSSSGCLSTEFGHVCTRQGISNHIVRARDVLNDYGVVIACCCEEHAAYQRHQSWASRGTMLPQISYLLIIAMNQDPFARPLTTPCQTCHNDGKYIVLARLWIFPLRGSGASANCLGTTPHGSKHRNHEYQTRQCTVPSRRLLTCADPASWLRRSRKVETYATTQSFLTSLVMET